MTVHKADSQYRCRVTLADTPRTWPDGPHMSTLHALLLFGGVPLLVIIAFSLMVLAPSWVKGPRYRIGQPWQARSEWFGPALSEGGAEPGSPATAAIEGSGSPTAGDKGRPRQGSGDQGGASAGW
jgi:hypothetical protein